VFPRLTFGAWTVKSGGMDESNFQIICDKVDTLGYDLVEILINSEERELMNGILRWSMRNKMDGYSYWVVEMNNGSYAFLLATGKYLTRLNLFLNCKQAVDMYEEQYQKDQKKLDALKLP